MTAKIKYEGNKLILPEVDCNCGMNHVKPDMDIYIGNNILDNCATYLKNRKLGKNVLIVADNNTYKVAGCRVEEILKGNEFNTSVCVLEREGELVPDQTALGEVMLAIEKETDFLVAVGSGSVNDLVRYAASCTKRAFASIGTAASMDGYTSVASPLINMGLKINKKADYPKVLICDLDIIKNAPYDMTISGFGDVLGKYIAKADWKLGGIINNEICCPLCIDIVSGAVDRCVKNIDKIRKRTNDGIKSLIEALILTGITILISGQTRAVASNEHNMSHFWEMAKLQKNEKAPSHGTSVGVATFYVAKFYEYFFQIDESSINKPDIKKRKKSKEDWEKEIINRYGRVIGPLILKSNPDEYIDWTEQERRIDAVTDNMDHIRKELSFLPKPGDVIKMLSKIRSPLRAEDLGIDKELLENSLFSAKDYRERYTVFKTVNELGLLEDFIKKLMEDE